MKNLLVTVIAASLVCGCAQWAREHALEQHRQGRTEQALKELDAAVPLNPYDAELRAAQLSARSMTERKAADTRAAQQLAALPKLPAAAGFAALRPRLKERRPVELDLRAAPLAAAIELLAKASGLHFILDRDVKPEVPLTLFFKATAVEEAVELVANAALLSVKVIDAESVLLYPNTAEKHKEHQEQVVRVFHLANADAKATAQFLRSMLRVKEAFVDERTNMVAIRESPEVVELAERLVALHDLGDPEVMLEVEVLEVKRNRLTELGVALPNSVTLTPLPGPEGALTLGNLRRIDSGRVGIAIGNVVLNLRREAGDFNILANPRIRAKSREKARVVIGDRFPVVTSTATATGLISENVSYLDVGLKLDVEPVVSVEDEVTIKLALEVSAIAGSVRTERSVAYQVGTRNASTVLRLRDGETQVLAGLISNDDRTNASRIPGLGDLPIAGRLFSSTKDESQRTELMLAITPRILRKATRPEVAEARLRVGTENSPRLRDWFQAPPQSIEPPVARAVPAAGTTTPTLVWKSPEPVRVGEVLAVPLQLATDVALRGLLLEINFSPQSVEVLGVQEGGFFSQGGARTSFTHSVDAQEGKLSVGVLRSDAVGVRGDLPLIELRLKAKTNTPVELRASAVRPIASGDAAPAIQLEPLRFKADP